MQREAWRALFRGTQSVRFSFSKVRVFLAVLSPAGSYIRDSSFIFLRHGPSGNEVDGPQEDFKWERRTEQEKWRMEELAIENRKIKKVKV